MDRRKFLSSLVGGLAATAAVRSFPFRVFSFPTKIVTPRLFLRVGDVVCFNGVHQINPHTMAELDILKSFVVVEDVYTHGDEEKVIQVSPAILTKGPYQNCVMPEGFKPSVSRLSEVYMTRHIKLDDFKFMYSDVAVRGVGKSEQNGEE